MLRHLLPHPPERSEEILDCHWPRLLVDQEWSRFVRRLPLAGAATFVRVAISLSTFSAGDILLTSFSTLRQETVL
jgi:hypothetical protein